MHDRRVDRVRYPEANPADRLVVVVGSVANMDQLDILADRSWLFRFVRVCEKIGIAMPHTPGPWIAIGDFIGTDEPDPQTIAYVDNHRNRNRRASEEQAANARLIAAAPEILAALVVIDNYCTGETNGHDRLQYLANIAQCALRKAEGAKP